MKSLRLFIERPVFATVVNILVILVGAVAFTKLAIREYPNIDVPVVSVTTAYSGASAYIMESQVTDVLEESLSGIDGIDFISSKSKEGVSEISVHFILSRHADAAASDVRDRVARVRTLLPDEIKEPVIAKVEADATPFMYLAITSKTLKPADLNEYVEKNVKDVLQTIPGVAEIRILGERRHAMRVWLKKDRMAAFNVTVSDIENAIREQNIELPAGLIESTDREFSVYPKTALLTEPDFRNIIVRADDYQVLLSDVANVVLGVEDDRSFVRYNGETAIGIGVVKQATANPLTVAREVHSRVDKIKEKLPAGMAIAVPHDSSVFIEGSIDAVWSTLVEAFVLVLLVIFLFLQSARATFIPMAAIPVSLIGAFIFMLGMGFTINTLTLLALVLAIGLVVDDAIVMLENIYRHLEQGKTPFQASVDGAQEIGFPVVAMTLTLAAVFAPVAFSEGRTGKLFVEFALTLTGAVLVSGFVALTLSPMLCSQFLKPVKAGTHPQGIRWLAGFDRLVDGSRNIYLKLLNPLLTHRWIGWLLLLVCLLVSLSLMPLGLFKNPVIQPLADELSPVEDRGYFFTIAIAPEGSTPDFVSRAMRGKEQVYENIDEVRGYFVVAGYPDSTQGISFVPLTPYGERQRHSTEVAMDAMKGFFMIPDIMAFAMPPQSLGSGSSTPISVMLQTSGDYESLMDIGNQLVARMQQNPGMNQVRLDLRINKPELQVTIDRQKAADLGIPIQEISRTLETMLGSREVTRFKDGNEQYQVIVQMSDAQRNEPSHLKDIYLRTDTDQMVALTNLINIEQTTTANALPHFNKYRAAQITAGVNPGYSLGQAVEFMETELAEISPETNLGFMDTTREYLQSGDTLVFAMMLALVFIYLVLAAQFESFTDPFIILTSVLPAFVGALLALKWSGGSLNIYSKIGLITLVGLITKHGILMVEFANQTMLEGASKLEAIRAAATTRYRPIWMTAAATVLGAIPLAVATGPGAETRHEIGWVIVGGLSLGTVLTLLIVPVVFVSLSRGRKADLAVKRVDNEAI
ncbi:Efflux pump membrane transporter BepE [BD1-7 clade bacterium]|uniref:Efflux pump membrane transporter BepE n=1 Tax=BD1-7 clade bacterium TaxID=2029982 RepID=A0A5S9PQ72_9GAMM|nr:Efflux pump membrane transporter BepE [BD1-7 clade bacterium]CAA0106116.1 Efflux pump membrane transporter BepE [BD1-7 clade bacterium]